MTESSSLSLTWPTDPSTYDRRGWSGPNARGTGAGVGSSADGSAAMAAGPGGTCPRRVWQPRVASSRQTEHRQARPVDLSTARGGRGHAGPGGRGDGREAVPPTSTSSGRTTSSRRSAARSSLHVDDRRAALSRPAALVYVRAARGVRTRVAGTPGRRDRKEQDDRVGRGDESYPVDAIFPVELDGAGAHGARSAAGFRCRRASTTSSW